MKTIEIIYGIVILGAFGAVVAITSLTHTRGSAAVPVVTIVGSGIRSPDRSVGPSSAGDALSRRKAWAWWA